MSEGSKGKKNCILCNDELATVIQKTSKIQCTDCKSFFHLSCISPLCKAIISSYKCHNCIFANPKCIVCGIENSKEWYCIKNEYQELVVCTNHGIPKSCFGCSRKQGQLIPVPHESNIISYLCTSCDELRLKFNCCEVCHDYVRYDSLPNWKTCQAPQCKRQFHSSCYFQKYGVWIEKDFYCDLHVPNDESEEEEEISEIPDNQIEPHIRVIIPKKIFNQTKHFDEFLKIYQHERSKRHIPIEETPQCWLCRTAITDSSMMNQCFVCRKDFHLSCLNLYEKTERFQCISCLLNHPKCKECVGKKDSNDKWQLVWKVLNGSLDLRCFSHLVRKCFRCGKDISAGMPIIRWIFPETTLSIFMYFCNSCTILLGRTRVCEICGNFHMDDDNWIDCIYCDNGIHKHCFYICSGHRYDKQVFLCYHHDNGKDVYSKRSLSHSEGFNRIMKTKSWKEIVTVKNYLSGSIAAKADYCSICRYRIQNTDHLTPCRTCGTKFHNRCVNSNPNYNCTFCVFRNRSCTTKNCENQPLEYQRVFDGHNMIGLKCEEHQQTKCFGCPAVGIKNYRDVYSIGRSKVGVLFFDRLCKNCWDLKQSRGFCFLCNNYYRRDAFKDWLPVTVEASPIQFSCGVHSSCLFYKTGKWLDSESFIPLVISAKPKSNLKRSKKSDMCSNPTKRSKEWSAMKLLDKQDEQDRLIQQKEQRNKNAILRTRRSMREQLSGEFSGESLIDTSKYVLIGGDPKRSILHLIKLSEQEDANQHLISILARHYLLKFGVHSVQTVLKEIQTAMKTVLISSVILNEIDNFLK